jgi:LPXTG-motif cell wall-anchored protein
MFQIDAPTLGDVGSLLTGLAALGTLLAGITGRLLRRRRRR